MTVQEPRILDLLHALKLKLKTNTRTAAALGVTERTVIDWLRKTEDDLRRLHPSNIEQIRAAARDHGITAGVMTIGPALWDFEESYEAHLQADPGVPPRPSVPFSNGEFACLGYKVNSRLGAAASLATSSAQRIAFLADTGVDVIVYKTVRSEEALSVDPPNVNFCDKSTQLLKPEEWPCKLTLKLHPPGGSNDAAQGLVGNFGMPCPPPEIWQADFRKAQHYLNRGQLLILSVAGVAEDSRVPTLIADFVRVLELGFEAGASVFELNFSCPNCLGLAGSIYRQPTVARAICKAVRKEYRGAKLIAKIGYLPPVPLRQLMLATAEYLDGYTAINGLGVEINAREGLHRSLVGGLSGKPILRLGLSCVAELARIREVEHLAETVIFGCGGIGSAPQVESYLASGADFVQAATAFLHDSYFGYKAREYLDRNNQRRQTGFESEVEEAFFNCSKAQFSLLAAERLGYSKQAEMAAAGFRAFSEWKNRYEAATSMGPRRALPVPSIEDFRMAIIEFTSKEIK